MRKQGNLHECYSYNEVTQITPLREIRHRNKMQLLVLLIVLLSIWESNGICGPEFGGKCTCGIGQYQDRPHQFIVNCTNTGFKDAKVLQHLPANTQVLIFTGNHIPELPWNIFGTLNNYTHLRVVDMSSNHIQEIRGKSYHRVSNVERLILNHNDLTISRDADGVNHHHPRIFSNFVSLMELHLTNAFADNTDDDLASDLHDIFVNSNLTRLVKLHLEQNEIKGFHDPRVFCDLPNLMDLHLANNNLSGIDFNITCLNHLRFIDLEWNQIYRLTAKQLTDLDSLPKRNQSLMIDLTGNHFLCDCEIRELYSWLQETQVHVRNKEVLRCHRGIPPSNGGKPILGLSKIECPPRVAESAAFGAPHQATAVVLGILSVILIVLLVTVLYMNRMEIKHRFMPVLDTVSRKVQYTTIGKQEEQEMEV